MIDWKKWQPEIESDLLDAHRILMEGLINAAGAIGVVAFGVMSGSKVIQHGASGSSSPSANARPLPMAGADSDQHRLSRVRYFIMSLSHSSFADGTARMGGCGRPGTDPLESVLCTFRSKACTRTSGLSITMR